LTLLVISYGCRFRSVAVYKKDKDRILKEEVVRGIFVPKTEKITGKKEIQDEVVHVLN
jgi:hypothetical protein